MNTIRMIAVALPVMLLMACGGGGGGGGTAAVSPTTPPINMPGTGDPNMPDPVTLPGYAVDASSARTAIGGVSPTSMTETAIVSAIQSRATAANRFEFSNFGPAANAVNITCTNNSSCSGTVPDVENLTFSLTGIDDLSLVDDMGLMDFDSDTQSVMVDRNVTVIQSQAYARQSDGTQLTFQTYGGWLADSVFGVELLDVTESGTPTSLFASFSFGKEAGSNPTGSGEVHWDGVMVGALIGTRDIVQGDARVTVNFRLTSNDGTIGFDNIKNLNTGADVSDIGPHPFNWTAGVFATSGASRGSFTLLEGSFYGDNHEEIGGVFSTTDLHGSFGATKQ